MSDVEAAGRPAQSGRRNPWLIAVVVSIATFMEVLDTTIANVALRHIAGSLAASQDQSTWVVTSYLVANAVSLAASGWLATAIGRKRFYMACVALFTVSSLLCGLSWSLESLILFRVLQGLGGGGMAPSEQSILAVAFPPEKRGQAFAGYGVAVVVAPVIGPTLGGWITDTYSWHWVFLINLPMGILSLALVSALVHEPRAERGELGRRFDPVGFALVAIGLGSLEVVLDEGQRNDWFQSGFIVSFAINHDLLSSLRDEAVAEILGTPTRPERNGRVYWYAEHLIKVLAADRPDYLREAVEDALSRGKRWRERIAVSVEKAPAPAASTEEARATSMPGRRARARRGREDGAAASDLRTLTPPRRGLSKSA